MEDPVGNPSSVGKDLVPTVHAMQGSGAILSQGGCEVQHIGFGPRPSTALSYTPNTHYSGP